MQKYFVKFCKGVRFFPSFFLLLNFPFQNIFSSRTLISGLLCKNVKKYLMYLCIHVKISLCLLTARGWGGVKALADASFKNASFLLTFSRIYVKQVYIN